MYKERGVNIEPKIAGLMCAAILSDTLMFRSPTCTDYDEQVAKELAKIAGIDIESFALSMFEVGSDFGEKSIEEILYTDFKTFVANGISFGVSQVSAVTDNQLNEVKANIYDAMKQAIIDKNLNMVFVMLTNILEQHTELIRVGNINMSLIQPSFPGSRLEGDSLHLDKVVSRKKQLIPGLMEAFDMMQ
jgi:manganese-dependent inorganic pyrophosphatase